MRRILTTAALLLVMATYAAPASAQVFRAYRPYYGPTYGYSYYGPAYGYATPYYYAPRAYWGTPYVYRPYAGFYRYPTYGYPAYYYGW